MNLNEDRTLPEVTQATKPYHHGDLWQALVRAGIEILRADGVHGLTLRAVARRAGVSHAAPYRHFADKEALLAAIAEDGYHLLASDLADLLAMRQQTATDLLRLAGHRYVQFVLANPDDVRVMFSGMLVDYDKYPDLCAASNAAFVLLVELITRLQAEHAAIQEDPYRQALAAWSMMHGLASLLMEQSFPPEIQAIMDVDALIDYCAGIVMRGFRG